VTGLIARTASTRAGRWPVITVCVGALACLPLLLPSGLWDKLIFDAAEVQTGQWWRLLAAHWTHVDGEHLAWNLAALALLAALIERVSRRLLLWTLTAGMLSVDLLLLSPLCSLDRYCGLSGVLNGLFVVTLFLLWQQNRSPWVIITGVLCGAKILVELAAGEALFTSAAWPPYAAAHLAGAMAAPVALWAWGKRAELREKA
jgi:rhomboid family GlyGly-CTERM serine protease